MPSISWCGSSSMSRRSLKVLDELVGIELHEEAILEGAGLALVAVDDDVAGEDARRAEAPLHATREAGATTAQQLGRLDLVVDLARLHAREGLAQRGVATRAQVAVHGVPVGH